MICLLFWSVLVRYWVHLRCVLYLDLGAHASLRQNKERGRKKKTIPDLDRQPTRPDRLISIIP
jgi:hypothetical protein